MENRLLHIGVLDKLYHYELASGRISTTYTIELNDSIELDELNEVVLEVRRLLNTKVIQFNGNYLPSDYPISIFVQSLQLDATSTEPELVYSDDKYKIYKTTHKYSEESEVTEQ